MGKRALSVLLAFCMALTSLPATAWAAQEGGTEPEAHEADVGQEEEPAKENTGTGEEAAEEEETKEGFFAPDFVEETETEPQEYFSEDSESSENDSDAVEVSGTLSSTISWKLNLTTEVLTLMGSGLMDSFSSAGAVPWNAYRTQITRVTFAPEILSVGDYAFSGCTRLETVVLPEGLTSIGNYAFNGCTNLAFIRLPDSLGSIGEYAFQSAGLTEITIPKGVASIGQYVFSGCSTLQEVSLEDGISVLGSYMFSGCTELKTIVLPDSLNTIGAHVFQGWTGLTEISIPENVTSIGNYAFNNCTKLVSVNLPSTLTDIGGFAFQDCTGLTEITIPEGVTGIGQRAFNRCTQLALIRLPGTLGSVGEWAFADCPALKEAAFGEGISTLGSYAFNNCTKLTSVSLPSTLTGIGDYAFQSCSSLIGITIPEGVVSLGSSAFDHCTKLASVELPSTLAEVSKYAFRYCSSLADIKIPEGVQTVGYDAFGNCSSLTEVRLPSTVTKVDSYAFESCSKLTAVYFYGDAPAAGSDVFWVCPDQLLVYRISDKANWGSTWSGRTTATFIPVSREDSVAYNVEGGELIFDKASGYVAGYTGSPSVVDIPQRIDDVDVIGLVPELFRQCTSLTSITLPEGLRAVGNNAFNGCTALTSATLPGTLAEIGERTFEGCTALANVTLGQGMTNVGYRMFSGCTALTSIKIPDGVTTIGNHAFSDCSSLAEITIADGTGSIGDYAFCNCTKLASVQLPGSLSSIGEHAFQSSGLTKIIIPEGVTGIGQRAFNGCTQLALIQLPGTLDSVGEWAFADCPALKEAVLGKGISALGIRMFSSCTGLETIELPDSLKTIGDYAFWGCTGLTGITVPEGVASLGSYAFNNCTKLASVSLPSTLTGIGDYAFQSCSSLTGITIPEGVVSLGSYAFEHCTKLASVELPSTLAEVSKYAFRYCSSLADIKIPEGIQTVGYEAFRDCSSLSEVRLPSTVTKVDSYAFESCSKLTVVYFYGDAPMASSNIFYRTSGLTIFYLAGRKNWTFPRWNGYPTKSFTEDAATRYYPVAGGSLEYNTKTGTITGYVSTPTQAVIPTKIVGVPIVAIADNAFQACTSLTEVCIPDSVTQIGQEAFPGGIKIYGGEGSAAQAYAEANQIDFIALGVSAVSPSAATTVGGNSATVTVTMKTSMATPLLLECKDADGNACTVGCTTASQSLSSGKCVYTLTLDLIRLKSGLHDFRFYSLDYGFSYSVRYNVDRTPPAPPADLVVTPGDLQNTVTWREAAQAKVTSYRLYRAVGLDGRYTLLTTVTDRKTLTYADKNVNADTEYFYKIASVDSYGMEGETNGPVTSMPNRDTAPPQITGVSPANNTIISGTVSFTVQAEDNMKVRSISASFSGNQTDWSEEETIYTDGKAVFTVDTTAWENTFYVRLRCEDVYGNSAEGSTIYRYTIDNNPPGQVTGLRAETSSTAITLRWNAVADEDFDYFLVEKQNPDGAFQFERKVTGTLGVHITGLVPGESYTFRVCAYDRQGNRGTPSEPVTVVASEDTEAPVVTSISPMPGRYNGDIPLRFGISDNYSVLKVIVQTSRNNRSWTDVTEINVSKAEKTVSVSYTLHTADMPEGVFSVRAVAVDFAGNQSDVSSKAPFTQYVVDRTPPAAPEGLKAEQISNVVYLTWPQGPENDLGGYTIYRSTSENGAYQQLASGLTKLSYTDRLNLLSGTTYYYKIACRDTAGNPSESSVPVALVYTDTPDQDTTLPRIISVSPSDGVVLGKNTSINVKVYDNNLVTSLFYHCCADDGTWTEWKAIPVDAREHVVELPVIVADLAENVFSIEVYCKDSSGNVSDTAARRYTLDMQPPEAPAVTAERAPMAVTVQWNTANEEDLAGFYLYRKASDAGSYSFLAQFANSGETSYSYSDQEVSADTGYSYYVVAVDERGNSSESQKTADIQPLNQDVEPPVVHVSGSTVGTVDVEMSFDAANSYDNVGVASYAWDFGDGSTSNLATPSHAYDTAGTYTVSLTISDAAGNQSTDSFSVKVKEPSQTGKLTVTVRDENGAALSGAGVYFNFGSDEQNTVYTDASGSVCITAESGSYQVAAYKNGYLPAKDTARLIEHSDASLSLTLVKGAVVTGSLTVTPMTLDEIEAAGIDITDPANQEIYQNTICLVYDGTEVELGLMSDNGYGGTGDHQSGGFYPGGYQPGAYQPATVSNRSNQKRILIPLVVGGGIYHSYHQDGSSGGGMQRDRTERIIAVLDMPFEVTWAKDFFDVHLYVFNEAGEEFALDDCSATLNLPSGLSLVTTGESANQQTVSLGSIPGKSSAVADWIIRGDTAGKYTLNVDFHGKLRGFNEIIGANFATKESIHVRNGDNLHLNILTQSDILAYTNGELRIGLRNEDPEPYFGVNFALENASLIRSFKKVDDEETQEDMTTLKTGEELWFYYEIERKDWEKLLKYEDKDFHLIQRICENLGNSNLRVHFGTFGGGGEPDKPEPDKDSGLISITFWEDKACTKEITSMTTTYGSFSWGDVNATPTGVGYDSAYIRINDAGLSSGERLEGTITAPKGFSFSLDKVERNRDFTISTANQPSVVEIYPVYEESYQDNDILTFQTQIVKTASNGTKAEENARVETIPVRENPHMGKIYYRDSFTELFIGPYDLKDLKFSGFEQPSSSASYNRDLARLSAALSMATYKEDGIKLTFRNLGFSNVMMFGYNPVNDQATLDQNVVASAFASKKYIVGEDIFTIAVVAVRGTLEDEWYSNFDIGPGNQIHNGFNNGKKEVLNKFDAYMELLKKKSLQMDKIKFLVTGHSRGAAVADLVTLELNNNTLYNYNNIFAYTFATPHSIPTSMRFDKVDNIYNIINDHDLVAHVPGTFYSPGSNLYVNCYNDPQYYGKFNQFQEKFDKMVKPSADNKSRYKTWGDGGFELLEVFDRIPVEYLANEYGSLVADLMLKKLSVQSEVTLIKMLIDVAFSKAPIPLKIAGELLKHELDSLLNGQKSARVSRMASPLEWMDIVWANHATETYMCWVELASDASYFPKIKLNDAVIKGSGWAKVEVRCPVNVYVYNEDHQLVTSIENNEITQAVGPYCEVNGEDKIIYLGSSDYTFEIIGYDEGQMDIEVVEFNDEGQQIKFVQYNDLPVESQAKAILTVKDCSKDSSQYSLVTGDGIQRNPDYSVSGDEIGALEVSVSAEGGGTVWGGGRYSAGERVILYTLPDSGYHFKEWQVVSGGVSIIDDCFTMPEGDVTVKAIFEQDGAVTPPDQSAILEAAVNGQTLEVSLEAAEAGTVYCAEYDGDGKLLSVQMQPVSAGEQSVSFTLKESGAACRKIFLLNPEFMPLCTAKTV